MLRVLCISLRMSFSPNSSASIVNRTINLNYANKKRSSSFKWLVVNLVMLLLFVYDLSRKCVGYTTALHWAELCCAAALAANALQHALRLARLRQAPLALSPRQARLLGVAPSARGVTPPRRDATPPTPSTAEPTAESLSPARVWRAADASPPPSPPSPASPASPRFSRLAAADEFIADRRSLADYLREQGERARMAGAGGAEAWAPRLAPAPAHHYQLAALDSEGAALEESAGAGAGGGAAGAGAWRRLLLEPERATEWNQNLRLWLHVTILQRLERELARVDAALAAQGLALAGVERLQKLPAAAALLPYLEPFADQRYCVRRVRELARGGCLSAYRWCGGGADWDEGKPTDAELLLQLLSAYLDAQLAGAGARAFSAGHVAAAPAAPAPRRPAIHRAQARPPHYVLLLDNETVEVARGRNNLLHTLLLLIAALARAEPPALQRLHLGPAGLNMLWIIGR